MKHIIVGGDSFSYYTSKLENNVSPNQILYHNNGNWFHFLENDLQNEDIPYRFYYLGLPSAGTHYIIDSVTNKVDELLSNGILPKDIYVFTQFTYFFRNILSTSKPKLTTSKMEQDYFDLTNSIENREEIVKEHLNDIYEFGVYLDSKDVNAKFFFQQDMLFYFELDYSKFDEELEKLKWFFITNDDDRLDGILEHYLEQSSTNMFSAYISRDDLHFNPIVYYYWYIDKIKPLILPFNKYECEKLALKACKEHYKINFFK